MTDETKRTYAAMVQAMDKNVAAILAELDKLGLRDNTIVVFTSDNGATKDGSNLPFRGGKHTIYEGGTRLPTVDPLAERQTSPARKWDGLCGALDMFPTLMAMAELKMPATRPLDGKNIWPALRDNTASPVESYYWVVAQRRRHPHGRLEAAPLLRPLRTLRHPQRHRRNKNVADAHPDVVKSLTAKMNAWAESLGAALTHQPAPAKLDAKPAPEGEVLEVTVTVTDKAKPKDTSGCPIRRVPRHISSPPTTSSMTSPSRPAACARASSTRPSKATTTRRSRSTSSAAKAFDQFGREQATGPEPKAVPGVWEHRVIGLCSSAPGMLPRHGLVFRGGKPGTYKIYLDNLRIRHADGTTTPIWTRWQGHPHAEDRGHGFVQGGAGASRPLSLVRWQTPMKPATETSKCGPYVRLYPARRLLVPGIRPLQ